MLLQPRVLSVQKNSQTRLQRKTRKRQQLWKVKQKPGHRLKPPRVRRPVLKPLRTLTSTLVQMQKLNPLHRLKKLHLCHPPSRCARWLQCAAMTAQA